MAAYTTIDNPELYFQTVLWTGNASTGLAVTLDGDEDMQPDLVWIKYRGVENSPVNDSARGVQKYFYSNEDNAEGTESDGLTAFSSNGFTVGSDTGWNYSGGSGMCAWCWKESATAGFDMVLYTGNATGRTISHSLSAVPHLMLIKNRSATGDWMVYHHKNTSAPETDYLYLNLNSATQDSAIHFNDTAPTSSVFSVGTGGYTNGNTNNIIAYLFSEKQGYSKFGSYTGNGNADGPFIYTGFRPAWIMVKRTDTTNYWTILDNKRDTYNPVEHMLWPNVTDAEDDGTDRFDFCSNGFKCVNDGSAFNTSGGTYIYAAFAEAPFVNSNGVPCNAR